MINKIKTVIVSTVSALALMSLAASPVMAQQAQGDNCVIVYGIQFCTKKTPFVIGTTVIDDATMLLIVLAFACVFAVVLNAVYLRSKLQKNI